MPRGKRNAAPAEPVQTDIEDAIAKANAGIKEALVPPMPADLIREYREKETWAEAQDKAYAEFMKPHRERMAAIKQQLLAMALEQKVNGFPTDFGHAYISTGLSHKVDPAGASYTNPETGEIVTGREAVLDWLLANWDDVGAEHAQINVGIDGVKAWIEKTGAPPPGITVQQWQRINIRKA